MIPVHMPVITADPADTTGAETDLLALAARLGPATSTLDEQARRRLADAAAAAPDLAHMTEVDRLWVTYDPEYPAYRDALGALKVRSAAAPEFTFHLSRVPQWWRDCGGIAAADTFEALPHYDRHDAYAAFRKNPDAVAIARAGVVLACKR